MNRKPTLWPINVPNRKSAVFITLYDVVRIEDFCSDCVYSDTEEPARSKPTLSGSHVSVSAGTVAVLKNLNSDNDRKFRSLRQSPNVPLDETITPVGRAHRQLLKRNTR